MFNLILYKNEKVTFYTILFMSLNLFSQDIKYGDGLFEINFTVDMMYTDDLKNYKVTASGEAGPYGRAYLSYEFKMSLMFQVKVNLMEQLGHRMVKRFTTKF